jgi:hypothetical protein
MAIQTETETNADGELPADVDDRARFSGRLPVPY